jgi:hypothetical protein
MISAESSGWCGVDGAGGLKTWANQRGVCVSVLLLLLVVVAMVLIVVVISRHAWSGAVAMPRTAPMLVR